MKVRIYKPSRNAMQSGLGRTGGWVLEYETVSARRPEPLIGWVGSEDTLNQVKLSFDSAEDAVAFAQKNGWVYTIDPDHGRKLKPRNYVDNFRYIPPAEDAK